MLLGQITVEDARPISGCLAHKMLQNIAVKTKVKIFYMWNSICVEKNLGRLRNVYIISIGINTTQNLC